MLRKPRRFGRGVGLFSTSTPPASSWHGPDPRGEQSLAGPRVFQQALADAGLAGLTYPKEYGGQGLTQEHERIWREEYAKYRT